MVVADLTRRLKNAQLTIEAERTIAKNATAQADLYRQKMGSLSNILRLEAARTFNIESKHMQQMESQRFESNKERATNLHQQLRLEEVDFWMTKNKREPLKLQKLRTKVANLETEQESQKKLLQELTEIDSLNEKLSTAAQMGDLGECNDLLRSGAWVNYIDAAGYLPIHYACANGYYEVVKLCLEFGADHSSFLTGHSPIVVAASNGHIDIIDLLLSFGANIEDKGSGRCPATIAAMMSGNFETFAYLLNEAGADINSFDGNENTALHLAARLPDREQSIQTILFLLDRGADTQRINRKGNTALQVALYDENKPAAHALGGEFTTEVVEDVGSTAVGKGSSNKRHGTATQLTVSASAPNLNGQNAKARSGAANSNIQYLPRNIDSPQRMSISQFRSSSLAKGGGVSSNSKKAHTEPEGDGAEADHGAAKNKNVGNREDIFDKVQGQARRQAALGSLSSQLQGKPAVRAAAAPSADSTATLTMGTRDFSRQSDHSASGGVGHIAGKTQSNVVSGQIARKESAQDKPAGSVDNTSITVESLAPPILEDAQFGGMLDSQSVISAVTFGTAQIGNS